MAWSKCLAARRGRETNESAKAAGPRLARARDLVVLLAPCFVLLPLSLVLGPQVAWAGSGGLVTLPYTATKWKSGLKLEIDTTWIDGDGYRPVRVEALNWPPGPAPADRTFRIVLRPRSWEYGETTPSVTFHLDLPQGAARARTTVSIPQHSGWGSLDVQVYEDGVWLEDVSGAFGIAGSNLYGWSEALPGILIVDTNAPGAERVARGSLLGAPSAQTPPRLVDIRQLASRFPNTQYGAPASNLPPTSAATISDTETLNLLNNLPRVALLPPSELPNKWIDYTCFDVVFLSLEELRSLVKQHPDQWQALRSWTATGPALCIFGVDLDSPQLAELERCVALPAPAAGEVPAGQWPGWTIPSPPTTAEQVIRGLDQVYARQTQMFPPASAGAGLTTTKDAATPAETSTSDAATGVTSPTPFIWRPLGLGRVVACRTSAPFSPDNRDLVWLFNDLDPINWRWYQRQGFSLRRENSDYWNLGVPGVGAAPIKSYLTLITVFAIVIGPVNYVVLRRRRRLYLLLVTVPGGAAFVTGALLAYALVSDGLGVRARVRSFTEIDQRRGQAVTWARQSYYAGLAPSRGLAFSVDVACYPIEQFGEGRHGRYRSLIWDDQQRLLSGYLSSRSTAQFMVVQAHASRRGLQVAEAAGQSAPPQVTNGLNTTLEKVVLRDAHGKYYWASQVAPGQVFQPLATQQDVVVREFKSAWLAHRPVFPVGYDPDYYNRGFGRRNYYYNNVDQGLPPAKFDVGLLERSLKQAACCELTPGSYLAITRTSPELPLGVPAALEQASFHMVKGRW